MAGEVQNGKKANKVKNLQFLKSTNRATVIKEIVLKKAQNRSELSKRLGLTRMAIGGIVNELIEENYIEESAQPFNSDEPRKTGRVPVTLKIADRSINAIGIYVKRYEIHCVISDIQGGIFYHEFQMLPVDADNKTFLFILRGLLDRAIEENKEYYLAGIGIASIGPLDIYGKRLFFPPNFYRIGDICFEEELASYHLPVVLDNDMNASALAEHYYGVYNQNKSLAYIGFSSGVGAGIIIKGKVQHGSAGFAGEVGHVSINPNGPKCECGQHGCIELYTSISNLLLATGTGSVKELAELLGRGQVPRYVEEGIRECRAALKTMLITIANMYDPEIIILGEIPKEISAVYIENMEEYLNMNMFHHGFQRIQVRLSSLEQEAAYIGAASLIFQEIFNGEIELKSEKV